MTSNQPGIGNGSGIPWDLCPETWAWDWECISLDDWDWDSQIPSFETTWDSNPMGFLSPMGPIGISWDSFSMGFRVPQVV